MQKIGNVSRRMGFPATLVLAGVIVSVAFGIVTHVRIQRVNHYLGTKATFVEEDCFHNDLITCGYHSWSVVDHGSCSVVSSEVSRLLSTTSQPAPLESGPMLGEVAPKGTLYFGYVGDMCVIWW